MIMKKNESTLQNRCLLIIHFYYESRTDFGLVHLDYDCIWVLQLLWGGSYYEPGWVIFIIRWIICFLVFVSKNHIFVNS